MLDTVRKPTQAVKREQRQRSGVADQLPVTVLGPGRYGVVGRTRTYTVEISGGVARCDCPDHTYRKRGCRHLAAVWHHLQTTPLDVAPPAAEELVDSTLENPTQPTIGESPVWQDRPAASKSRLLNRPEHISSIVGRVIDGLGVAAASRLRAALRVQRAALRRASTKRTYAAGPRRPQ